MKTFLTLFLAFVSFICISQSAVPKKGKVDHIEKVIRFIEKNHGNGGAKFRLKGMKGEPLFVWNGNETAKSMLSLIGPEDIESVMVTRSGKEVGKYGEKAKHGLVQIQTKPYENESVAYIYKGKLLYDFAFDQIEENRSDVTMVNPMDLKKYLNMEVADHVQNVQVINSPKLVFELSLKKMKDDEEAWNQVWENNKSVEQNRRKLEKEALAKDKKGQREEE